MKTKRVSKSNTKAAAEMLESLAGMAHAVSAYERGSNTWFSVYVIDLYDQLAGGELFTVSCESDRQAKAMAMEHYVRNKQDRLGVQGYRGGSYVVRAMPVGEWSSGALARAKCSYITCERKVISMQMIGVVFNFDSGRFETPE